MNAGSVDVVKGGCYAGVLKTEPNERVLGLAEGEQVQAFAYKTFRNPGDDSKVSFKIKLKYLFMFILKGTRNHVFRDRLLDW